MTPTAVLFDCDGVLVDSEPPLLELMKQDFADHGLVLPEETFELEFVGGTLADDGRRARELGASLPKDWEDDFYERIYAILAVNTPLVPGIPAVLDALDARGLPYAVGSNGSARKMEITLGQHPDIYRRLAGRLFSGQELGCPKPQPGLYLHAAAALNTAPEMCVVIEDSATGARAARAAGIPCFGFAAHDGGTRLKAEGAQVFHDMMDLPGLLGL